MKKKLEELLKEQLELVRSICEKSYKREFSEIKDKETEYYRSSQEYLREKYS
jgi:hypothetical protein